MVGGILAGKGAEIPLLDLCLAALSAALVAAGGNSVNDAFDVDVDRINRPQRPIPSGQVSVTAAFAFGCVSMSLGVIIGFILHLNLGLIALLVSFLLLLYNAKLKKVAVAGNLIVSLCGALAFIYGALAVQNPTGGVIPAIFAFLIHLGREIVKDVEDLEGDLLRGAKTLPIIVGSRAALRWAAGILILLVLSTPVPFIVGWLGSTYLILVVVLVDIPLLITSFFLVRDLNRRNLSKVSMTLKIIMVSGLMSLYLS